MREIKFRAWDKNGNIMIYSNTESSSHQWWIDTNGITVDMYKEEWDRLTDLKFMQYTGLKDKNDVEIYEGDIVNCTSGCPHQVVFKLEHGGNTLGGMPTFYLSGLMPGYQWTGDELLIGNIYENPELLKGANE